MRARPKEGNEIVQRNSTFMDCVSEVKCCGSASTVRPFNGNACMVSD